MMNASTDMRVTPADAAIMRGGARDAKAAIFEPTLHHRAAIKVSRIELAERERADARLTVAKSWYADDLVRAVPARLYVACDNDTVGPPQTAHRDANACLQPGLLRYLIEKNALAQHRHDVVAHGLDRADYLVHDDNFARRISAAALQGHDIDDLADAQVGNFRLPAIDENANALVIADARAVDEDAAETADGANKADQRLRTVTRNSGAADATIGRLLLFGSRREASRAECGADKAQEKPAGQRLGGMFRRALFQSS